MQTIPSRFFRFLFVAALFCGLARTPARAETYEVHRITLPEGAKLSVDNGVLNSAPRLNLALNDSDEVIVLASIPTPQVEGAPQTWSNNIYRWAPGKDLEVVEPSISPRKEWVAGKGYVEVLGEDQIGELAGLLNDGRIVAMFYKRDTIRWYSPLTKEWTDAFFRSEPSPYWSTYVDRARVSSTGFGAVVTNDTARAIETFSLDPSIQNYSFGPQQNLDYCDAGAINNSGKMVAACNSLPVAHRRPFIFTSGTITPLKYFWQAAWPRDINEDDVVVGAAYNRGWTILPVVWRKKRPQVLKLVGPENRSVVHEVTSINNRGEIVGQALRFRVSRRDSRGGYQKQTPLLWELKNGTKKVVNLRKLIPNSPERWAQKYAKPVAINNCGSILVKSCPNETIEVPYFYLSCTPYLLRSQSCIDRNGSTQ